MDIPGLSMDGHCYSGIHGYSDKGGGGGRVDIPGLSMDGHSYSGIRGCSDKGGGKGRHPWTIHRWLYLVWAYADICPGKVLGNTKVTVSSMDDSGLSTAPSDNPREKGPWAEHLRSLPKRGVGTLLSVSTFNHERASTSCL